MTSNPKDRFVAPARERSGHSSPPLVPLYHQIREELRARILDRTYAPHGKLPSESELMAAFGVSRITVRQALRDLHKEGLIFSIQGKGCFVTKPKAVQELARLQGFGEAMAQRGYETYSRVIFFEEVPARPAVASALGVEPEALVIELQRVRYLSRTPVSLDVSFFPLEIGRRLAHADLISRDVFAVLENDLGLRLRAADLTLEATTADAVLSRHLAVAQGAPILRIERLTYVDGERPIDFEYLYYAGDAHQYRIRIERS
jgi:GntR family transcriptional regulator